MQCCVSLFTAVFFILSFFFFFVPGFISDIMPPLCLLSAAHTEQAASFRCRYHAYIVYSLDSHFTLCCLCSLHVSFPFFCLFVCLWHKEWMLSEIEGWVMRSTKSASSLPYTALLCRPERCLIKVNAFPMNMNASTKCLLKQEGGILLVTLGFFCLSVAIKSLMCHFNLERKLWSNILAEAVRQ